MCAVPVMFLNGKVRQKRIEDQISSSIAFIYGAARENLRANLDDLTSLATRPDHMAAAVLYRAPPALNWR
jgi:hypothetical protein